MAEKETFVKLPCDLVVRVEQNGKEVEQRIPAGSKVIVDGSMNLVLYGGWVPKDMRIYRNEYGVMTNGRVVNQRVHKTPNGRPSVYDSSTYIKAKGQLAEELAEIGEGSTIAIAGYVNTDQQGKGPTAKFLRNLFVTDFGILDRREPTGNTEPSEGEKAAISSQLEDLKDRV